MGHLGINCGLFEDTSGFQVSQKLDDVFGHRWRSGQVITGGLESVLVGDPVDGEDVAFGVCEGVASLGDGSGFFGCLTDLLLGSAFLYLGSVFTLEPGSSSNENVVSDFHPVMIQEPSNGRKRAELTRNCNFHRRSFPGWTKRCRRPVRRVRRVLPKQRREEQR